MLEIHSFRSKPTRLLSTTKLLKKVFWLKSSMKELEPYPLENQSLYLLKREKISISLRTLQLVEDQLPNKPKPKLPKHNKLKPNPNKPASKVHHRLEKEFLPVPLPRQLLYKKASTFPRFKVQALMAAS